MRQRLLRIVVAAAVACGQWAPAWAAYNQPSVATSVVGFRNRVINGDMRIDQRNAGASQTITAGAALAYTVDRFYAYSTGANVTGQRVAGSGSTQNRYQLTGAAGVTAIGFGQRIEAANSYDLAGSSATLSVDLADSLLTSVTWTAYYATSTDTFGTLASPTRTQIATGAFTVSSTLSRQSTTISIPSAATTGVEVVLSVGAQTSGTLTVGNVQIEPGTAATAYEKRPVAAEYALCSWYFWQGNVNMEGYVATTSSLKVLVPNGRMRIAPAPVLVSTTTTNFTSPTTSFEAYNSATFLKASGSNSASGDVYFNGIVSLSSEL